MGGCEASWSLGKWTIKVSSLHNLWALGVSALYWCSRAGGSRPCAAIELVLWLTIPFVLPVRGRVSHTTKSYGVDGNPEVVSGQWGRFRKRGRSARRMPLLDFSLPPLRKCPCGRRSLEVAVRWSMLSYSTIGAHRRPGIIPSVASTCWPSYAGATEQR